MCCVDDSSRPHNRCRSQAMQGGHICRVCAAKYRKWAEHRRFFRTQGDCSRLQPEHCDCAQAMRHYADCIRLQRRCGRLPTEHGQIQTGMCHLPFGDCQVLCVASAHTGREGVQHTCCDKAQHRSRKFYHPTPLSQIVILGALGSIFDAPKEKS